MVQNITYVSIESVLPSNPSIYRKEIVKSTFFLLLFSLGLSNLSLGFLRSSVISRLIKPDASS